MATVVKGIEKHMILICESGNGCAGGSERWRNMGDKGNRKRKEGMEEERGTTLQTKWLLWVDEKEGKGWERKRKTEKE